MAVVVQGQTDAQSSPPGIVFHPASAVRAFVGRSLLESCDAKVDELHLTPLELIDRIAALVPRTLEPATPKRSKAHYLWAVLIARIYEVFLLLCLLCGGQMSLIAFITEGTQTEKILDHIGVDSEPPHISPARGPPLRDDCSDAQTDEGMHIEPDWATDWDLAAQPAPDYEVDQRINW